MQKNNYLRSFLILTILFFVDLNLFATTRYTDGIIAVVNDNIITLKDLKEYLNAISMSLLASGRSETEIREILSYYQANGLMKLIEDQLIIAEAHRRDMVIRDEIIDQRINEIKDRYPSESVFFQDLASQGMTLSGLRERITNQVKMQHLEDIEIRSKIFVNPQSVTDFFKDNPDQFQEPERVSLYSIFIAYADEPSLAEKKAEEALRLLTDPNMSFSVEENFEKVSRNFSDSPSIGMIRRGEAIPEIEKIVFNLKKGEVSPLVRTEEGIFIFRLNEKFSEESVSLLEVKDAIYNFLFQEEFNKRRESWLKNLQEKSYIEIKQ